MKGKMSMLKSLKDREVYSRAQALYRWANEHSGGLLTVLRRAFQSFNAARAAEAAASLAYYTLFSLFPLLLALIAAGSFFLEGEQVRREVVASVTQAIPISQELIESNVQRLLERRGTVGLVGLIGLLWSGTGVFTALARHINRACSESEPRNLLEQRLVALGIIGMLAVLLLLSLLSAPLLSLLSQLQLGLPFYETRLWTILSDVLPWLRIQPLFTLLIFMALYRWVPNTAENSAAVGWREAFGGALFVALAWEGAKRGFTWYLGSGLVRYRLVYGSLGAVVALMLWIYLSNWLALFGAHLSAAIALHTQSPSSH
jgi:membrane protein